MNHAERAEKLFFDGLNCCQAVFLAFDDLHGIPEKQAIKLTSGMGGGIGRLREVCGAVSGMVLAAGLLLGPDDPLNAELKAKHYALVQEMAFKFKENCGSFICRDLLALQETHDIPIPAQRTPEYYKDRPCATLVYEAARILDTFLEQK